MGISIDGTEITGLTIDGDDVTEVTVDGDVVWEAGPGDGITVIDDFESGSLGSNWAGSTSGYTVSQNSTLESSYVLEPTGSFVLLYYDVNGTTTRGNEYRTMWYADTNLASFRFHAFDQVTNGAAGANDDNYYCRIDQDTPRFQVGKFKGEGFDTFSSHGDFDGLATDTVYQCGLRVDEAGVTDNVTAFILDASGAELYSVSITDDEWTSGTVVYNQTGDSNTRYDYLTERPLDAE